MLNDTGNTNARRIEPGCMQWFDLEQEECSKNIAWFTEKYLPPPLLLYVYSQYFYIIVANRPSSAAYHTPRRKRRAALGAW